MAVVTLTAEEYAAMLRVYECKQAPVAINGYLYLVRCLPGDTNLYRVAVT